jgi:F-type H+-transporting ATPase subunit a
VLVWIAVALIIIFFLTTYRNPKLVPGRAQWLAESLYGFVRDRVAGDLIGHEGIRFAPYLTTLFSFILLTNLFGIIPGIQISPNTHIAFPVILALTSYVLFIYTGIRRFGFWHYWKKSLVLPAPWYIPPLLIPIEFFHVHRAAGHLAIRLFANMFAAT